jgi:hypothetical protein
MKQVGYRMISIVALSVLITASLIIVIEQAIHLDRVINIIPKQQSAIEMLKVINDTTKAYAIRVKKVSDSLESRVSSDSILISKRLHAIAGLMRAKKHLQDTITSLRQTIEDNKANLDSANTRIVKYQHDSVQLAISAEKYRKESDKFKGEYADQIEKEIKRLGGIVYAYWANIPFNDSCQYYAQIARRYADAAHVLRDEEIYNDKNRGFLNECRKLSVVPESAVSLLLSLGYCELDAKALKKELHRNLPVAISISRLLIGINDEIERQMRVVADRAS